MLSHRLSSTRLYRIWQDMRYRCECKTNGSYKNYGARGIAVCDAWQDPVVFIKWAKKGWRKGLTLERKNVNGPYSPRNCCWITRQAQSRNRTDNIWLIVNGKKMLQADVVRMLGGSVGLISFRRSRGKTGKDLVAPIRKKRTIVYNGVRMSFSDAARLSGIGAMTIKHRVDKG